VLGTLAGVLIGDRLGSPEDLGLDALFPAFFLGLLIEEGRTRAGIVVAIVGAAIALALTPVAPPGVPILAASLAVLVGVRLR
jgi:predicted branched-subunit amino acid permease